MAEGNKGQEIRSRYYEKIGLMHEARESETFSNIFNKRTINTEKLKNFCLKFTVPDNNRQIVWYMLLDIFTTSVNNHEFFEHSCQEKYELLFRYLTFMRKIDETTSKGEIYLQMYIFEELNIRSISESRKLQILGVNKEDFLVVATCMRTIDDHDHDSMAYYLTKHFIKHIQILKKNPLREYFHEYMCSNERQLGIRLESSNILKSLPLDDWFSRCFAGILHLNSLKKIWDKVICGSSKTMVYVVIAMLSSWYRSGMTPDLYTFVSQLSLVPQELIDRDVFKMLDTHAPIEINLPFFT